jgi:hypothetical protein
MKKKHQAINIEVKHTKSTYGFNTHQEVIPEPEKISMKTDSKLPVTVEKVPSLTATTSPKMKKKHSNSNSQSMNRNH